MKKYNYPLLSCSLMSLSRVGRDVPNSFANSVLFISLLIYWLYKSSNLSDLKGLCPEYTPFLLAMAMPSLCRSNRFVRSNSAIADTISRWCRRVNIFLITYKVDSLFLKSLCNIKQVTCGAGEP